MPILAHFGEVFWGFDPLNVVKYCRDPQRSILDRSSRSVKKCDLGMHWRKQKERKKEKRKETQRCDKSHICPDHPRWSTPHQSCHI